MCGGYKKGENPSERGKNKIQWITNLPAGLRGRVIFGKGNDMEELIRKQSAIDVVREIIPDNRANGICEELNKLPSAELSTNLAEVGTDAISRQQAIDAMAELQGRASSKGELTGISKAWKRIKQLPPIQPKLLQPWEVLVAQAVLPQPKRGKWIKTARWGRVYYCDQCRNYLDFDGVNAGRGSTNYCPNCGADMRGEQDG